MAIERDGNNIKLTGDDLEAYLKIRFPDYEPENDTDKYDYGHVEESVSSLEPHLTLYKKWQRIRKPRTFRK